MVLGAVLLLIVGAALAGYLWGGAGPRLGGETPTPATDAASSVGSIRASASCTRSPSHDATGTPVSYEPARAVDGVAATAWRCDGDGVGQRLELAFDHPVRLRTLGIVPGLAKTDPGDGTDRYAQNRRIAQVRFTFDAGPEVILTMDTTPTGRGMQYTRLGGDGTVTRTVTITILASVPGVEENAHAAIDSVAISEVGFG